MKRTVCLSVDVEEGGYVSVMACVKYTGCVARAYLTSRDANAAMAKSLLETKVPSLPVTVRLFDPQEVA